jgi:hypothetical protein
MSAFDLELLIYILFMMYVYYSERGELGWTLGFWIWAGSSVVLFIVYPLLCSLNLYVIRNDVDAQACRNSTMRYV